MSSRLCRASQVPCSLALVIACSAVSACGPRDEAATDSAAAAGAGATAATSSALGDAQIAHIAVTANAIDSSFGAMALTKARSQAVKDFAQTMVTDHGGVNRQAVELAQRLGVTPAENDVSRQLQAAADSARSAMEGLSGAAFDSAYMAREVAYHQAVLDAQASHEGVHHLPGQRVGDDHEARVSERRNPFVDALAVVSARGQGFGVRML